MHKSLLKPVHKRFTQACPSNKKPLPPEDPLTQNLCLDAHNVGTEQDPACKLACHPAGLEMIIVLRQGCRLIGFVFALAGERFETTDVI